MAYAADVGKDMNQITTRHLSVNPKSGLGVFERTHLLECLQALCTEAFR